MAIEAPDVPSSSSLEWPYRFEILPLANLYVDERYQRPLSRFYRTIVARFEPALVGTLVVSERRDGFAIIDGQSRHAALAELGHPVWPGLVYRLTVASEADLFARFQSERRGIRPFYRFRAELVAGNAEARAIDDLVHSAGFTLSDAKVPGVTAISAIAALRDAYRLDEGETLTRVLTVLVGAWPDGRKGGTNREMIAGLAWLLAHEQIDDARLIRRLAVIDPEVILRRAAALREGRGLGGGSPSYMARALMSEYTRKGTR